MALPRLNFPPARKSNCRFSLSSDRAFLPEQGGSMSEIERSSLLLGPASRLINQGLRKDARTAPNAAHRIGAHAPGARRLPAGR
jgi:hypothetical protein